MDARVTMETESFLDELKRDLDKELPPEDLTRMVHLIRDKLEDLGYGFEHCELPSDVVTFLENNMKGSKVISVLKHALAVMKFHGRFGSKPFAGWIEKYQASHVTQDDDNFVGRRRDIEHICEILRTPSYLGVWIYGFGGLGKTTVAKEIGSRVSRHGAIRFLSVDLKQADTICDIYRSILRLFDHSSHETDHVALQNRVLTVLTENIVKDTWILLDNVEDIYSQEKDGIESFLTHLHFNVHRVKVKLLVTSRVNLDLIGGGMCQYKLGPLDDEASLRFLRYSCKPAVLQESQYHEAMLSCGNIPLALVLVSNTISQRASQGVTRFSFSTIADRHEQVQECIEYAYGILNEDLQKTLVHLTVFDRSRFDVASVAHVLDVAYEEAAWILMQLCHYDMLQKAETLKEEHVPLETGTDYTYFYHELVLRFFQQKLTYLSEEDVSECQNRWTSLIFLRLKRYYGDSFGNSKAMIKDIQDSSHLYRRFFKDLNPRLINTRTLSECEHMQMAATLVMTTDVDKIETIKHIERNFDQLECRYYWKIEEATFCIQNSCFNEASALLTTIENDPLLQTIPLEAQTFITALLYYQKGRLHRRKQEFSNAKEYLQKALDIFEQNISRSPEIVSKHANVLNALGNVAYNLKEFDKALDYHTKAVEVMQVIVGESTHHEMSMFKFNIGTNALAKARHIKRDDVLSDDDKMRVTQLMELCLGKMDESIADDVQLGLHILPDFADKLQYRSDARLELEDFKGALNDAKEALTIRDKLLEGASPKRMLTHHKIGRIYMKERELLKPGSSERTELLKKAKDCFDFVAGFVLNGDLTRDSEGIEPFLVDYEKLARVTCDTGYMKYVETLCLRVRAGENVESSSESSSSSSENLDTSSGDSDVNDRKDSGVQMNGDSEDEAYASIKMLTEDEELTTEDTSRVVHQRLSSDEVFHSDDESEGLAHDPNIKQKRKRQSDSD